MQLTQKPDILQSIIDTYFTVYGDTRLIIIYDTECNVRFVGEHYQTYSGIDDLINLTSPSLRVSILNKQRNQIRNGVIKSGISANYLISLQDCNSVKSVCRVKLWPLFSLEHETIGCAEYFEKFNPFSLMDKVFHHETQINQISLNSLSSIIPPSLATRELEIVFLLLCRYSQSSIAKWLGISRNTVKSTIQGRIIPKFNLAFQCNIKFTSELLELAMRCNFQNDFPASLLKQPLTLLDNFMVDFH